MEDNIRQRDLQQDKVPSRPSLDTAPFSDRPISVNKQIAAKWNDPFSNPITSLSNCHGDFAEQIDIGWKAVVGVGRSALPTEENIRHWTTDMNPNNQKLGKKRSRQGYTITRQRNQYR